MQELLPWVWSSSSLYCLAIPIKYNDELTFRHKVYATIDAATAAAVQFDKEGFDVFYAVGTLKSRGILNEKTGKNQVRTHANIDRIKSFILDIDCGEGKPYATKLEGLSAVKTFCKQSGMPSPTIVDSGNGLHIYWIFDTQEGTPSEYWLKQAIHFKQIVKFYKLHADPTRTADVSSILRVPGTHNYKDKTNPKEVKIIKFSDPTSLLDMLNIFEKIIAENDIEVSVPLKKPSAFDGIASNLSSYPKASGVTVLKKCQQMARVKEVGGPVGYAMRSSACSIIKQFDVVDYSILWGNDPDPETVKKQTVTMINDSITDNPHTCVRFEEQNPGGCDGCKNKGSKHFKSPIVFGMSSQEAPNDLLEKLQNDTPKSEGRSLIAPPTNTAVVIEDRKDEFLAHTGAWLPKPPYPYKRAGKGAVICEPKDSDGALGDATMVYEYDIYPYERVWDAHTNCEMVKFRFKLPHDGWREVYTELFNIADQKSFSKLIAVNGILAGGTDRTQQLGTYMNSYIKHIQSLMKSTENFPQLGWQKDGDVFVLPEKSLHSDGHEEPCGVSTTLKDSVSSFRKHGRMEEWKKVIDTYNRPGYEPYAFGHLVGYGSLLFQFTDYHGAIVNMVGDSGSGKSTVLKSINSIFGHPDEPMLTQIDTDNAKMNRIGVFNSICVTYDEITNIEPEQLSQFCYAVTQGRAKHRLGQDSVEKENNRRWKMILASTSNANLMHKLSSLKQDASAESLRVFEYYINSQNIMTKTEAGDIFGKLKDNFGHAGEIFIAEVIKKQDKVRALVKETIDKFDKLANVPNKERYWSAIVGCTIAGGIIAKKLGLCDFDMDKLLFWAIAQVQQMRTIVDENKRDPKSLLVEYMNSIIGNTLVVGGGVDKDKGMYIREEVKGQILARSEIDAGVLYLSKTAIRGWLTKGGTDVAWVRKSLLQSGILVDENRDKVLTAGSNVAKTGQTRCWVIRLDHPEMSGAQLRSINFNTTSKETNVLKI